MRFIICILLLATCCNSAPTNEIQSEVNKAPDAETVTKAAMTKDEIVSEMTTEKMNATEETVKGRLHEDASTSGSFEHPTTEANADTKEGTTAAAPDAVTAMNKAQVVDNATDGMAAIDASTISGIEVTTSGLTVTMALKESTDNLSVMEKTTEGSPLTTSSDSTRERRDENTAAATSSVPSETSEAMKDSMTTAAATKE